MNDKITKLSDFVFYFLVLLGGLGVVLGTVILHTPLARWTLLPGVYAPEAYKIIVYSLFSIYVLKPIFGKLYGVAFLMVYSTAEAVGNAIYIGDHFTFFLPKFWANFLDPIPAQDPFFTFKLIAFYSVAGITLYALRNKFSLNPFCFSLFALCVMLLVLIGYPTNMQTVPGPAFSPYVVFVAEAGWMGSYLLGWWGIRPREE